MIAGIVGLIIAGVVILISLFALIASRYKKCPSDKIMVIYGSVGKSKDGTSRAASVFTAARVSLCLSFSRTAFSTLRPYQSA